MKSILYPERSHPIVCLQMYVRIGSAGESSEEAGYSHFMEHLVFKATRKYEFNAISYLVNFLGGTMNAYTDVDCTCFYLSLPAEHTLIGLDILAEIAQYAEFGKEDVATEKDIILEEIKQYDNDPESHFLEYIQTSHFNANPLRHSIMGSRQSVASATKSRLDAFYRKYYTPANTFLVVTGDYDAEAVEAMIHDLFGSWQPQAELPVLPDAYLEPEHVPARFEALRHKSTLVAFVLDELTERHPQSDALMLAMRYLALGNASLLHKRLVDDSALCSSIKITSISGYHSGISALLVTPLQKKHIPRIIDVFRSTLAELLRDGIPAAEVELLKKETVNTWLYSFESIENIANLIAAEEFSLGHEHLHCYVEEVQRLTPSDVSAAAQKYWHPDRVSVYCYTSAPAITEYLQGLHPDSFLLPVKASLRRKTATAADISTAPQTSGEAPQIRQIGEHQWTATLPSGHNAILLRVKGKPVSGVSLALPISMLHEPLAKRGVNHLAANALWHSSSTLTHDAILRLCRANGITYRTSNYIDASTLRMECLSSDLEVCLRLLKDVLQNPVFDVKHLGVLKNAAMDSLRRDIEYPASHAYQLWLNMMFGHACVFASHVGSISTLRQISRADVVDWHRNHFQTAPFTIAIAGDHPVPETFQLLSAIFGADAPVNPEPLPENIPRMSTKARQIVREASSGQAIIHIGGRGVPASDIASSTTFQVLAQIIGGDSSSRMFDILREKHAFAYQTGFDVTAIRDLGFWVAYAYCDKEDYRYCLDAIQNILADVAQNGVTQEELHGARNYLAGMHRFESESVSSLATSLANLNTLGYPPEHYMQYEERVMRVEADAVQALAKKLFTQDNVFSHVLL